MNLQSTAWMDEAACRYVNVDRDDDPFFDPDHSSIDARFEWCAQCPVALECCYAGGTNFGIWGGLRERERLEFLGRHPRRDSPVAQRAFRRRHRALNAAAHRYHERRHHQQQQQPRRPRRERALRGDGHGQQPTTTTVAMKKRE